jgi:anti-sigma regulatory factor (Ser/Thr protein kinase)
MGQLRTALRSYALEDHSPGRTLQLVDRYARALSDTAMATAAYAILDPETGALQLASAGHLPPLVLSSGGGRVIDVVSSPPLGAFPYSSWTDQVDSLTDGEMLLFYTDGLIERPGTALTASIERLLATTAGASSAEDACALAVEHVLPFGRDDMALVAVHYAPLPAELTMRLAAEPPVLADIRRTLRRWLHDQSVTAADTREILLAVSEASANAIEHAYSPAPAEFEVRASRENGDLAFVVSDQGTWRNPRGEHRGRGLKVIRAAMDEVQINTSGAGTEIVMRKHLGR